MISGWSSFTSVLVTSTKVAFSMEYRRKSGAIQFSLYVPP